MAWTSGATQIVMQVRPNSTTIGGMGLGSNLTYGDLTAAGLAANDFIHVTGAYQV